MRKPDTFANVRHHLTEKVWHRRVGGRMFSGSSALCVNAKVMSGKGNVCDKFSDMEKMK
jgi:hypothetical protein